MQIKAQTVIPPGVTIQRCEPAPWSATCGPRDRFKVSGKQTKMPLLTKKQKAARKVK